MRSHLRRTAVAVVMMLGIGAFSGCAMALGNTRCNLNVQNPHQSRGTPRYMDSKLTFTCDRVVHAVSITIKMQRRAGGSWIEVPNSSRTISIDNLLANTPLKVMTGGNLLCTVGTFRTAGRGTATNAQGLRDSLDWYYGDPVSVTCPNS